MVLGSHGDSAKTESVLKRPNSDVAALRITETLPRDTGLRCTLCVSALSNEGLRPLGLPLEHKWLRRGEETIEKESERRRERGPIGDQ
jgi:hypothetical protein